MPYRKLKGLIADKEGFRLNCIMLTALLLSFISGLSIELYAPSLPNIAKHFEVSEIIAKNTITITMLGYSIGCLVFGVFMDIFGRRKILIPALFLFALVSLIAPLAITISYLMLVRFSQGLFISAAAIGSRALAVDYFIGKRFIAVILYTSLAYSLGLILGPLLGGSLQNHFGWQANFYVYAIIASIVEFMLLIFVQEKFLEKSTFSVKSLSRSFWQILSHPVFLASSSISGLIVIGLLVYPTSGVFLVQDVLGYSSLAYGNSALLIGLGYLVGTMTSRLFLRWLSQKCLIYVGFSMMGVAALAMFIFAITIGLTLWTLVIPIILTNYSIGFIQGNILAVCLKLFPKNAGINAAAQACFVMLGSSLGIFIINSFEIIHLLGIAKIFLFLTISQLIIFLIFIRHNMDDFK